MFTLILKTLTPETYSQYILFTDIESDLSNTNSIHNEGISPCYVH